VKWIRPTSQFSTGRLRTTDTEPAHCTARIHFSWRPLLPHIHPSYYSDCFFALTRILLTYLARSFDCRVCGLASSSPFIVHIGAETMARRNHFDRLMPRHHVGGFYTSASSLNDAGAHSTAIRRLVRTPCLSHAKDERARHVGFELSLIVRCSICLIAPPTKPLRPMISLCMSNAWSK
jgi:hypothetical protein